MMKTTYNLPRTENRPLLLETPENQCLVQRFTSIALSVLFWGMLLYALTPTWTWVLAELGYEQIAFGWFFDFIGIEKAAHKIKIVLYWGVLLSMVPVTWAMHNWAVSLEQGPKKAKEPNKACSDDEIAVWAGVAPENLKKWRSSQRLVVHLDQSAKIVDVEASNLS